MQACLPTEAQNTSVSSNVPTAVLPAPFLKASWASRGRIAEVQVVVQRQGPSFGGDRGGVSRLGNLLRHLTC